VTNGSGLTIETETLGTVQFQDSTDFGVLVLFPEGTPKHGDRNLGLAFFSPVLVVRPAEEDWFSKWAGSPAEPLRCRFVWGGTKLSRMAVEIEPLRHWVTEHNGRRYDAFILAVTDWERRAA
jgi:hypothetical protein